MNLSLIDWNLDFFDSIMGGSQCDPRTLSRSSMLVRLKCFSEVAVDGVCHICGRYSVGFRLSMCRLRARSTMFALSCTEWTST